MDCVTTVRVFHSNFRIQFRVSSIASPAIRQGTGSEGSHSNAEIVLHHRQSEDNGIVSYSYCQHSWPPPTPEAIFTRP